MSTIKSDAYDPPALNEEARDRLYAQPLETLYRRLRNIERSLVGRPLSEEGFFPELAERTLFFLGTAVTYLEDASRFKHSQRPDADEIRICLFSGYEAATGFQQGVELIASNSRIKGRSHFDLTEIEASIESFLRDFSKFIVVSTFIFMPNSYLFQEILREAGVAKYKSHRDEVLSEWLESAINGEVDNPGFAQELTKEIETKIKIFKAKNSRPRWTDRQHYPALAGLSAVDFLLQVHAQDIQGNKLDKEYLRAIDPELTKSVETYVSQRLRRGQDLGKLSGFKMTASRPAYNRRASRKRPAP